MKRKFNQILGVWDTRIAPLHLGGMLFSIEHLLVLKERENIKNCNMCLVGEYSPWMSLMKTFNGLNNIYYFQNKKELYQQLTKETFVWPQLKLKQDLYTLYGNTNLIRLFYKEKGYIPYLSIKKSHTRWLVKYINYKLKEKIPVTVHLKNNKSCKHCSNANFSVWYEFLKSFEKNKFVIIIIGDDIVDKRILALPHVVSSREYGADLTDDLSLIQNCFLFMGMASGPCNMAIFSDTPYIIFKDPNHHREEMMQELGDSDQYVFAKPYQFFQRKLQTVANLKEAFDNCNSKINISLWLKKKETVSHVL